LTRSPLRVPNRDRFDRVSDHRQKRGTRYSKGAKIRIGFQRLLFPAGGSLMAVWLLKGQRGWVDQPRRLAPRWKLEFLLEAMKRSSPADAGGVQSFVIDVSQVRQFRIFLVR
jgi:hypothetical protein